MLRLLGRLNESDILGILLPSRRAASKRVILRLALTDALAK
jgi:hypothetical protein